MMVPVRGKRLVQHQRLLAVQHLSGVYARLLVAQPEARIGDHDRHRRQGDEVALVHELEIVGLGKRVRAQPAPSA